ncbi:hypothetical protein [Sapientia aquatica]|nr:hypothetical protein [Sapientia aquatica]
MNPAIFQNPPETRTPEGSADAMTGNCQPPKAISAVFDAQKWHKSQ